MQPERRLHATESKERQSPHFYLNEYVAYYALNFLEKHGIRDKFLSGTSIVIDGKSTKIEKGAVEHLYGMGYLLKEGQTYTKKLSTKFPTSQQFINSKEAVLKMAEFQINVINGKSSSVRRQVVESSLPQELIALSGTCLMESSYKDFLGELYEDHLNVRGSKPKRTQPENAWGAGIMMEPAAKSIATDLANYIFDNGIKSPAILELGSGNASSLAAILDEFSNRKSSTLPRVLATDNDRSTCESAWKLFKKRGYEPNFSWQRTDMGDADDLRKAKRRLDGGQVFVHIGYILHESNTLAEKTLNGLSKVFSDATFLFTEYYLQEEITTEVPLHFQTIHTMSGQELKSREDNMARAARFGFKPLLNSEGKIKETVHNWIEKDGKKEPLNSTIFFSLG